MASTTTPRRIALAQIKDTHLNICNDGVASSKSPSCGVVIGNSLSPYPRKKLHRDLTPLKSFSMADYKYKRPAATASSESTSVAAAVSAALKAATGETSPTINDTAGLAATKLKLKLQLAFYKIQKKKKNNSNNNNKNGNSNRNTNFKKSTSTATSAVFESGIPRTSSITNISRITTKSILSENPIPKPAQRSVSMLAPSLLPKPRKPTFKTPPLVQQKSFLPTPSPPMAITPPLIAVNYAKSANINLQTKTKLLSDITPNESNTSTAITKKNALKPSLSYVASQPQTKTRKQNQRLRLLQIKKNSIIHQQQRPPLTIAAATAAAPQRSTTSTAPLLSIRLPRISNNQSFSRGTSLPSIQKILKTPIKNSSSTRSLVSGIFATAEDTIEEDDTILESNTPAETSHTTSAKRKTVGDDTTVLLSSSPVSKDDFGTPNLFSVAKSLLQLGGYKMS